mmetsp:Transcript_13200/g.35066  ORF Transcript_13200/g.35066 Transcript_13200/m.35066 type:complete len:93 (-) Transcript_13200:164-442(-)
MVAFHRWRLVVKLLRSSRNAQDDGATALLLVVVDGSAAAEEITVVETHIIMERMMSTARITEWDLETIFAVIREDDITKQEEGIITSGQQNA